MLSFHIISIFPEFFSSPLACGQMLRAQENKIINFSFHNPREFSENRHRHVDDRPYGGGPGMVMQLRPLHKALLSIEDRGKIILLSAAGRALDQKFVAELAKEKNITLVCGRYEGIDARLEQLFPLECVSVGNAVLNGGESAALTAIEAISRLLPGYMGKPESGKEESFTDGLLEYPQYTRPENFNGLKAPSILLGGNHAQIARWRRFESLWRTMRVNPELLAEAELTEDDHKMLAAMLRPIYGRNLCFCLTHYPVKLPGRKIGTASLTNLDIHDIARISRSYGMGPFFVLTPIPEQYHLLKSILNHWRENCRGTERSLALENVQPVHDIEEALQKAEQYYGVRPKLLASSASWPKKKNARVPVTPEKVRFLLKEGPVMLCLGTAHGMSEAMIARCDGSLRPLRFLDDNHLSVRSAAAIYADRILGDFF